MQFKHPEVLYALFLLVIPVIIHLFQLRKFKKQAFTNVAFLKTIKAQTRKSSQLKKWLILCTRLLLLACVVLVFAQPFIPNTKLFNTTQHTVVYLDNSASMQLKGQNGNLLNAAKTQLLNAFPEDKPISVFTNDNVFINTTLKAIKNNIIGLTYSNTQLDVQTVKLKAKQLSKTVENTSNHFIWMSDFQQHNSSLHFKADTTVATTLVKFTPETLQNTSIDSVYIQRKTPESITINVTLSAQDNTVKPTIALFNNEQLVSKATASFKNKSSVIPFTLPNTLPIQGKILLQDAGLQYDNVFYFNINTQPLINVLSVSENSSANFLKRIYTKDEFNYINSQLTNLDYSKIPNQNLVVLNGLKTIPQALISALKSYKNNGGSILIIPSNDVDISSYNQLLNAFSNLKYTTYNLQEKQITGIQYNHPILQQQFYNTVKNFQYPNVASFYSLNTTSDAILSFEDDTPFVLGGNGFYVFAAALAAKNSNFKTSPLIIPVIYNIGLQSLLPQQLYYNLNTKNTIVTKAKLSTDDVITLSLNNDVIIPQQQNYNTYVAFKTNDLPEKPGTYAVTANTNVLQHISYNSKRNESWLKYHDLKSIKNATVSTNFNAAVKAIKTATQVNALWKWFAIFALVFLAIEMLILKFFK